MSYDEEPEEVLIPISDETITLTIGGYDSKTLLDRIAQIAVNQFSKEFKAQVAASAAEAVNRATDEAIRPHIEAAVNEIIEKGWRKTNEWGVDRGERATFAQRIEESLKPDQYNSSRQSLPKIIDQAIANRFNKELEDGCKRVREQVDKTIAAKITDALATSLGIKPNGR